MKKVNMINRRRKNLEVWRRYKKSPMAMVGLAIFSVFFLLVVFADVIAPYNLAVTTNTAIRFSPPSWEHLLGTDNFGRDVFVRIIHGSRISLAIGLASTFLAVAVGGIFGALAAYKGGKIDEIIMRFIDMLLSIPPILLALAIVSALGNGAVNLLVAISVANVPRFARLVRSVVLIVVEEEFVQAAHSYGCSDVRIIMKYILPNAFGPIMVQATMSIATMVLETAGLSFLGLGIELPRPEWGSMLAEAREYMRTAPYLVCFPGIAIVISALSLNLIGDGLLDALDPKLRD